MEEASAVVRRERSKFRTLVEQSLTEFILFRMAVSGLCNPRLCQMFGYTAEEMSA